MHSGLRLRIVIHKRLPKAQHTLPSAADCLSAKVLRLQIRRAGDTFEAGDDEIESADSKDSHLTRLLSANRSFQKNQIASNLPLAKRKSIGFNSPLIAEAYAAANTRTPLLLAKHRVEP